MTAIAVIQARLSSTRLPGKVLLPLGNHPVLYHVYHRTKQAVANTVVATTAFPADDPLVTYCKEQGIPCVRFDGPQLPRPDGSMANNVLARYVAAVRLFGDRFTVRVVRTTADCPFLNPTLVRGVLDVLYQPHGPRYVSNTVLRTYPRGMDVEGFTRRLLDAADATTDITYDREHVTPWIQRHAGIGGYLTSGRDDLNVRWRWTLDTPEDYAWMQQVAQELPCDPTADPPRPTFEELLAFSRRVPPPLDP